MTRVLVFGVFDFFHPGHLGFLRLAGQNGDELAVSVARDVFVSSFKGKKPLFNEIERLSRISDLPFVDQAVLSDEITGKYTVIREFQPNVICFGHDQNELENHCENWLAQNDMAVKTLKLPKIPHIRKDYAFLRIKSRKEGRHEGFTETDIQAEKKLDRPLSFAVFDRNEKLRALAGWGPEDESYSLKVLFVNDGDLPGKYASLIRETAWFYKYYTGTSVNKINIDAGEKVIMEDSGLDFIKTESRTIIQVKTD